MDTKLPLYSLWRSALVPGWGQVYDERPTTGALLAGGTLVSGYALYETNRTYNNTAHDLENNSNPFSESSLLLLGLGQTTSPSFNQLQDPVCMYLYSQSFEGQRAAMARQLQQMRYAGGALTIIYVYDLLD